MGGQLRGQKGKMEMDAFKEIELKWTALVREIGWFQVLLKHGEMIKE